MTLYRYGGYFSEREIITPSQCQAAKAITGLGFRELAIEADTCTRTLTRYITHGNPIYPPIVERIRAAFEKRGVRFTFGKNPGIQFKSDAAGGL